MGQRRYPDIYILSMLRLNCTKQQLDTAPIIISIIIVFCECADQLRHQQRRSARVAQNGRHQIGMVADFVGIRTLKLQRKNALFTGQDLEAENWATFASHIGTCKLGGINPQD